MMFRAAVNLAVLVALSAVFAKALPLSADNDITSTPEIVTIETSSAMETSQPTGTMPTDQTMSTEVTDVSMETTSPSVVTVSFMPASSHGVTSIGPTSHHSSPHTSQQPTTPKATSAPKSGFSGSSFAGGIALGLGVSIICFIAYRCYVIRANKGYRTM